MIPPTYREVAMAEICHNGYIDALRFLQEDNLISTDCSLRSLETDAPKRACGEMVKMKEPDEAEEFDENTQQEGMKPQQEEHRWLDAQLLENLPVNIKKALCVRPAGRLILLEVCCPT